MASLDDASTRAAVTAERALLGALGGGCQVPVGAFAEVSNGLVSLRSVVISPDGSKVVRHTASGRDAEELGRQAGEYLLAHGGREILDAVYKTP